MNKTPIIIKKVKGFQCPSKYLLQIQDGTPLIFCNTKRESTLITNYILTGNEGILDMFELSQKRCIVNIRNKYEEVYSHDNDRIKKSIQGGYK